MVSKCDRISNFSGAGRKTFIGLIGNRIAKEENEGIDSDIGSFSETCISKEGKARLLRNSEKIPQNTNGLI